jgi:IstB-like ATP binding protein
VQAFGWFGGVFPEIRFDNLASAVKKVLKGRRRVESDRFVALRLHYLFCSQFTTPGLEGAHEKGGVEGEVGRCRRNVVLLCRDHRPDRVELAVRGALTAGAIDGRAVAVLARRTQSAPPPAPVELTGLAAPAGARAAGPESRRLRPAARRDPVTTAPKNAKTAALEALIEAYAIELKLPTVRRRFRTLATEATREQQTPVAHLAVLLEAEMAERAERREKRRLIDARFPQIKRLEDFRFADNPRATIAALAEGS